MAPDLQSQVLADGAIVQRTGISVSNPVHLPDGIVLERHNLFAAFQKAVDGEPVPAIKDIEGVERDITLEVKDGTGILTYGSNRVAFPQAGLLSKRRETRQQLVADILKKNTLTLHACDRLQTTIEKPDYSEGDFFDARAILIAAPEAFATGLREKASKKVGGTRNSFSSSSRISFRRKRHIGIILPPNELRLRILLSLSTKSLRESEQHALPTIRVPP